MRVPAKKEYKVDNTNFAEPVADMLTVGIPEDDLCTTEEKHPPRHGQLMRTRRVSSYRDPVFKETSAQTDEHVVNLGGAVLGYQRLSVNVGVQCSEEQIFMRPRAQGRDFGIQCCIHKYGFNKSQQCNIRETLKDESTQTEPMNPYRGVQEGKMDMLKRKMQMPRTAPQDLDQPDYNRGSSGKILGGATGVDVGIAQQGALEKSNLGASVIYDDRPVVNREQDLMLMRNMNPRPRLQNTKLHSNSNAVDMETDTMPATSSMLDMNNLNPRPRPNMENTLSASNGMNITKEESSGIRDKEPPIKMSENEVTSKTDEPLPETEIMDDKTEILLHLCGFPDVEMSYTQFTANIADKSRNENIKSILKLVKYNFQDDHYLCVLDDVVIRIYLDAHYGSWRSNRPEEDYRAVETNFRQRLKNIASRCQDIQPLNKLSEEFNDIYKVAKPFAVSHVGFWRRMT